MRLRFSHKTCNQSICIEHTAKLLINFQFGQRNSKYVPESHFSLLATTACPILLWVIAHCPSIGPPAARLQIGAQLGADATLGHDLSKSGELGRGD